MGKICRFCGAQNGDERIFCAECGEALDDDLKFMMQAEKYEQDLRTGQSPRRRPPRQEDDGDAPLSPLAKEEKKGLPLPLVLLVLAAACAAAYILLFR